MTMAAERKKNGHSPFERSMGRALVIRDALDRLDEVRVPKQARDDLRAIRAHMAGLTADLARELRACASDSTRAIELATLRLLITGQSDPPREEDR